MSYPQTPFSQLHCTQFAQPAMGAIIKASGHTGLTAGLEGRGVGDPSTGSDESEQLTRKVTEATQAARVANLGRVNMGTSR